MYKCKHCDDALTAPVMTQFFRATNLEALTGRSHTSNVLTRVCKNRKNNNLEYFSFKLKLKTVCLTREFSRIPVFHGSTHRHCRCTDWPASMAR